MKDRSWIAVDLDGTLAQYHGFTGPEPGAPIPAMVDRVRGWVEEERKVIIFTARMSHPDVDPMQAEIIQDWLERHGMPRLEVTATKDYRVNAFYDDRAIRVGRNTGELLNEEE